MFLEINLFLTDLLGMSLWDFSIVSIWAIFGMVINIFSDITRRDRLSDNSPIRFNFKYWWSDNRARLILALLLTPVALVCVEQLFTVELTKFIAFSIGFGSDHLSEIMKRKNVVKNL